MKLRQAFPQWNSENGGIFKQLQAQGVIPWTTDATTLNRLYFGVHSGNKLVAPMIYSMLDKQTGALTSEAINMFANMAYQKYNKRWNALYETITAEYNPIENYNMIENETIDRDVSNSGSDTRTDNLTETLTKTGSEAITDSGTETLAKTGTDTNVRTGSEQLTKAGSEKLQEGGTTQTDPSDLTKTTTGTASGNTTTTEHEVAAFNSNIYQDSSKDTTQQATNLTETSTLSNETITHGKTETQSFTNRTDTTSYNNLQDQETHNTSDTTTFGKVETQTFTNRADTTQNTGTQTIQKTDSETEDVERSLNRSGNIGVTTTQQMLQQERELWNYNFFDSVFEDLDKVLTLGVY